MFVPTFLLQTRSNLYICLTEDVECKFVSFQLELKHNRICFQTICRTTEQGKTNIIFEKVNALSHSPQTFVRKYHAVFRYFKCQFIFSIFPNYVPRNLIISHLDNLVAHLTRKRLLHSSQPFKMTLR